MSEDILTRLVSVPVPKVELDVQTHNLMLTN